MRYTFHREAKIELNKTVDYYEKCQRGVGIEFLEEMYSTILRIIAFPEAWAKLSYNARRCFTNRFPFGIIYQIKKDRIRIIAVAHLHREPHYWEKRLAK